MTWLSASVERANRRSLLCRGTVGVGDLPSSRPINRAYQQPRPTPVTGSELDRYEARFSTRCVRRAARGPTHPLEVVATLLDEEVYSVTSERTMYRPFKTLRGEARSGTPGAAGVAVSMAKEVGVHPTTISRIWRGSWDYHAPARASKYFKLSTDPLLRHEKSAAATWWVSTVADPPENSAVVFGRFDREEPDPEALATSTQPGLDPARRGALEP